MSRNKSRNTTIEDDNSQNLKNLSDLDPDHSLPAQDRGNSRYHFKKRLNGIEGTSIYRAYDSFNDKDVAIKEIM